MSEQDINPKPKSRKGCIITFLIGLAFLLILAALAIPDFMRMMVKVKNIHQISDLRSIFEAQKDYFDKNGRYAGHEADKKCFELLQWEPLGNTYYDYYCDTDVLPSNIMDNRACIIPEDSTVTKDSFIIFAVANRDKDSSCDVWSVNDAGDIYNIFDDLEDKKNTSPVYHINYPGRMIRYYSDSKTEETPQSKPLQEKDTSPEPSPSDNQTGAEK